MRATTFCPAGLLAAILLVAGCNAPTTSTPALTPTPGPSAAGASGSTGAGTVSPSTAPATGASSAPAAGTVAQAKANFDFSSAQTVTPGTTVAGTANTTNDNYYKLVVPMGNDAGILTVTVVKTNTDWTPQIALYDASKTQSDSFYPLSGTTNPVTHRLPVNAGSSYFIKIDHPGSLASDYTVKFDYAPVSDPQAGANSFEKAAPLTLGQATPLVLFSGFDLGSPGRPVLDEDFFKFTVPTGSSNLTIAITNNSGNSEAESIDQPQNIRYTLYDATKTSIGGGGSNNDQANVNDTVALPSGGTYYLKLEEASFRNSTKAHTLVVTAK